MVLLAINTYLQFRATAACRKVASTGRHSYKSLATTVTFSVLIPSSLLLSQIALAQQHDGDFIDAFASAEASASDFHNERFHEAEQALLEGLGRRDGAPTVSKKNEVPSKQAHLVQVSAPAKSIAPENLPKIAEPIAQSTDGPSRVEAASADANGKGLSLAKAATLKQTSSRSLSTTTDSATKHDSDQQGARIQEPPAAAVSAKVMKPPTKPSTNTAQSQVNEHEAELRELRRQLADANSALAAAELEISRLSTIIQDASRARLSLKDSAPSLTTANARSAANPSVAKVHAPPAAPPPASPQTSAVGVADPISDLQVATITVDKADLRLGPGRNHSALMSLRRGSRLAVEARQGEWYRVFAPNGQRAWIHSSLVRFGDGAASLNDGSSVKVRGYDSKLN